MSIHHRVGPRGRRTLARAAAAGVAAAVILAPASALAHEDRKQGDLEMVVGFGTEPAYVGQPNSVQLILVHDGQPVADLGDTLDVEVSFGDADPLQLPFEPNFEVGEFGTPGDYRAWFIPTSAGSYTFHLTGTVDGEDVDQRFTSGPQTFGDVDSGSEIQYPAPQPTTGELADRIEREVPRLNDAIEQTRASAGDAASTAADDASSAKTLAIVGIVIGLLGVAAAGTAVFVARRPKKTG